MSKEHLLEERLIALEELQRRSVGSGPVTVCRVCYAEYDELGCPCGRARWAPLPAVIAEISLRLDKLHDACRQDAA